ncbi:hypothetical protein E2P81_ATG02090 [Venturia nashicola]|nr:hypothetical protein E2P81_ATG02090 [Venturia nashicola]
MPDSSTIMPDSSTITSYCRHWTCLRNQRRPASSTLIRLFRPSIRLSCDKYCVNLHVNWKCRSLDARIAYSFTALRRPHGHPTDTLRRPHGDPTDTLRIPYGCPTDTPQMKDLGYHSTRPQGSTSPGHKVALHQATRYHSTRPQGITSPGHKVPLHEATRYHFTRPQGSTSPGHKVPLHEATRYHFTRPQGTTPPGHKVPTPGSELKPHIHMSKYLHLSFLGLYPVGQRAVNTFWQAPKESAPSYITDIPSRTHGGLSGLPVLTTRHTPTKETSRPSP